MIAYVLLLLAATDVKKAESPAHQCSDGTWVTQRSACPPESPPGGPFEVRVNAPPPTASSKPVPSNNPGLWVRTEDYPSHALRAEEEGTVAFSLTVGPDGMVRGCEVTMTSGYTSLDQATCRHITRRARFFPARDNAGKPVEGHYRNRVAWKIPAVPSFARQTDFTPFGPQPTYGVTIELDEADYPLEALENGMRGYADIVLTISDSGTVTDCVIEEGTGHDLLDRQSCEVARRWTFVPSRDASGKAVGGTTRHLISWILPDAWKRPPTVDVLPKSPMQAP